MFSAVIQSLHAGRFHRSASMALPLALALAILLGLPRVGIAAETYFKPSYRVVADPVIARESVGGIMTWKGNTLLALSDAHVNGQSSAGAFYVYEQDADGRFRFRQRIVNPEPIAQDSFGRPSLDGNTALITAFGKTVDDTFYQGAAYIYQRNADTGRWELQQRLVRDEGQFADFFGSSAALQGDEAFVGAQGADAPGAPDGASGVVYRYRRDADGTWQEDGLITKPELIDAQFGDGVEIDGDTLLIRTSRERPPGDGSEESEAAVYVYRHTPEGDWQEEARLTNGEKGVGRLLFFPPGVILRGERFWAPAVNAGVGEVSRAGRIHVFARDADGTWREEGIITAAEPQENVVFGGRFVWRDDAALISELSYSSALHDGKPGAGGTRGVVYWFNRDSVSGEWLAQQVLTPPVAGGVRDFGTIAWKGETQAVVTAMEFFPGIGAADEPGDYGSAMYVFEQVPGPAVDFDVTMAASETEIEVGGEVTYRVEVRNADTETTATNVRLVNPLWVRGGMIGQLAELVTASSICNVENLRYAELVCQLGDLAPGAATEVEMTFRLHEEDISLLNVASVEADQPSRDMRRNHAAARTPVIAPEPPPPDPPRSSGGGAIVLLLAGLLGALRFSARR